MAKTKYHQGCDTLRIIVISYASKKLWYPKISQIDQKCRYVDLITEFKFSKNNGFPSTDCVGIGQRYIEINQLWQFYRYPWMP
jgi:hypothetical protein